MRRELGRFLTSSGVYLFWLHRITGVGVALFLLLHTLDTVLLAAGPAIYDRVTAYLALPPFRWLEALLVGAVIYHAINGLRIVLAELRQWWQ